jgi:ABC-type glycerol-3-phosphate transport system substrate-binding protein
VVTYALKSPYGKGGLLDFLLHTQALLPERLPDLIVLDSREIDAAAQANLLQPLEHDLPSGAYADLLPPAQAMAKYRGAWLAVPVTLDAQQLVYNSSAVKDAPASWEKFLAGNAAMVFPADGDDAFLLQYLHNGGHLPPASQPAVLDVNTVAMVLTFFQRAHAANLVPDSVFGIRAAHEAWTPFAAGQAPLAQVEATDYLAERERVPNSSFAAIPTKDGAATTLVHSWNYTILTSDPARHTAAAEFVNWITDPSRVAEWASAAKVIPARRSAFALVIKPRAYADFLLSLFDAAIISPSLAELAPYSDAWGNALKSVLRGQATPIEAATRAAQSLGQ